MESRTALVPNHDGDHVLPCNSLFNNLLIRANQPGRSLAVRDVNTGIERSYAELLSHVIHLRNRIRSVLPSKVINDLQDGNEVYMTLLAPGGYEFAVGALAILAIGAAISPISPAQPVSEAAYYVRTARSVALLTARSVFEQGNALASNVSSVLNFGFHHVSISSIFECTFISPASIQISSTNTTSPEQPALVIFTSGTSGPPKGAVLRFAAITDTTCSWAALKGLSCRDTVLHLLPVHHATGIWVSFFPFLLSGACIEFRSGSFDPEWTWNRLLRGGITHFSGVPTIYMRMMTHYNENLSKLVSSRVKKYRDAAQLLKVAMCGTSALPRPIDNFWTDLLGKRIVQRYGSSELFVIFEMPVHGGGKVPDGSVGCLLPGIDLKLVDDQGLESDEGEVRVRSPHMFSKYLYDSIATRAAHDEKGYFKSGDIARRKGDFYFIVGRSSVDIIKSGGYKISALDVEREILAQPYIGEAMVVGVSDLEFGQKVGAVVSLRNDEAARRFYSKHNRSGGRLCLDDLRKDIRTRLAGYKLPTLLRVVEGEIPKSATGKIVKKTLGPTYFPPTYVSDPEVQVWHNSIALKAKL